MKALSTEMSNEPTLHPTRHPIAGLQAVLLETKLAPPRLPAALVVRERLLRNLDVALSHRLTLLSAAAGWGKTTLLSAWATEHAYPLAWVSLDELDNEATRFWTAVITALRTRVPTVGALALAMLHSPEPPPLSTVLTVLLNELGAVPEPEIILLVLDDYHLIDEPAIDEGLTFLIDHLPAHLHVVLATRVDPELPLSRWRVRAEMVEIRAADLRFTAAEAASFFTQTLDDVLADDDVRLLEQRTEGWVAGLQLAALAMRQRTDRAAFVQKFTGGHRYLLDYVQEEILQRQPLPVQRFLLQTAVLPRLNAQICAALTGDATSQTMLEGLERHNLFVVPLDEQRQWYRIHDLFREVLLARLHTTEPALVPTLHQRAAHWHAARNELREAIAHALAAADFVAAADLIERAAPAMWLRGEAKTVHHWIGLLPDAVLLQHARFALEAARHLLEVHHATIKTAYARAQTQVEQTIARVEQLLGPQPEAPAVAEIDETPAALSAAEVELLLRRIRLLRALIAVRALLTRGDTDQMRLLAEEVDALSAQEEIDWKLIGLSITFWLVESLQRQSGLLIPKLLAAKQQSQAAANQSATLRIMRLLAFAYLRAGQLHLLHEECLDALALTQQSGEQTAAVGYLYYLLGAVYYAWNRLAAAADALQSMLHIAHTWQQADLLIVGHIFLVYILLPGGDLAAAEAATQQAEALIEQERFATHVAAVATTRVHYWLATGNVAAASTWAAQVELSAESWHPNRNAELLLLGRVYLAQQQYGEALALFERFRPQLDRPGDTDTTLNFLMLRAVALHSDGQREQAHVVVLQLLALTAPEDNMRAFLDGGKPMQQLLQSLLVTSHNPELGLPKISMAFVAKLLAAFDQEASQGEDKPLNQSHDTHVPRAPLERATPLIEPLTRREEEVLRLLLAGAANQEIAAKLVISLATVKKHVSNLLGKLGVTTRSQAIARARDWPYFPEDYSTGETP